MDTRTHTDDTGHTWTLSATLSARRMANLAMVAHAVCGPMPDAAAYEYAKAAHAHAARMARAITATPRGTYPPDTRATQAARHTARLADARLSTRTAHAANLARAAHVGAATPERDRGRTITATRHTGRTWATTGRDGHTDTRGYVRHARNGIRAMLDTVARERVAALRAAEMMRAHTGTTRTHAAWERAMMGHTMAAQYVPTHDGRTWDEWTAKEVVNARETRAAERGRGTYKRGPSAARVTTRDHYMPASALRAMPTMGYATPPTHATRGDRAALMAAIDAHPKWATYRTWGTRPTDGPCGPWMPTCGPAGIVCDVYPPTDDTGHTDTHAATDAPLSAAERQAATDYAAMAAIGPDIAAMAQ